MIRELLWQMVCHKVTLIYCYAIELNIVVRNQCYLIVCLRVYKIDSTNPKNVNKLKAWWWYRSTFISPSIDINVPNGILYKSRNPCQSDNNPFVISSLDECDSVFCEFVRVVTRMHSDFRYDAAIQFRININSIASSYICLVSRKNDTQPPTHPPTRTYKSFTQ